MMKKSYYIISVVAFAWCLLATSCTKEQDFQEIAMEDFSKSFKALVMGGKSIDANQDWSTVGTIPVEVSVDMGDQQDYSVYIYHTPPVLDGDAAYIGMAKVTSGESKTINVAKPAKAGLLYAACYDNENHAVCKTFVARASGSKVSFTGKAPASAGTRAVTSGNRWSVPAYQLPSLSKYTTGNLIEMTDQENVTGINDSSEKHLRISNRYTGIINRLNTYPNQSVYVTSVWTLTYDQRVTNGSVIVVGSAGKIEIPRGFKLTTAPMGADDTNGMIYVMDGGQITGDGTVEFTNSSGTYSYNAGVITAKEIAINSGVLFNAGIVGNSENTATLLTGETTSGMKGEFINHGFTYLTQTSGKELSIYNDCYMNVQGDLALYGKARMDDGSYLECGTLTLNGSGSNNHVLYMGNGAYLNCKGNISIDRYGIWGPSGSGYQSNAILKINGCSYCKTYSDDASSFLLDHVELILPSGYPTIFDDGAIREWDSDIKSYGIGTLSETYSGYYGIRLFYDWMNGGNGLLDVANYQWTPDNNGKYNYVWGETSYPYVVGIDESRMTCTYSDGPSYTVSGSGGSSNYHVSFTKGINYTPSTNWLYYAFDIYDSTNDFNYNDVILQVGTPTDNGDGTFTADVQIACVGTSLSTTVLNDGEEFGAEIHVALGTSTTANTTRITRNFRKMESITFNSSDFQLDKLPFTLHIVNANNADNQFSYVPQILYGAPSFIVVNGDGAGKWYWTKEKMNIGLAYPLFGSWGSNMTTAPDWYSSKNADASRVVTW
ncbi:MAG: hypothetical protein IJ159_00695 [Prevotella sp.]|nr:hypothetical protein [Prevotella sp.]